MSIFSLINTKGLEKSTSEVVQAGTALERDPYAPNYELVLRGGLNAQPFVVTDEIKKYISEITFEDNSDQFQSLSITFENQIDDAGGGAILSLIDSKLFAEGTIIECQMGYGNSLRTVGAADIVKKTPNYPSEGSPSFIIEAYDLLHRAARSRPKGGVPYTKFRDSQIASIIGQRNGFEIATKDPRSFENIKKTAGLFKRIQHRGVSDYEFLKKVAEINGFNLFSRFDTDQKRFVLYFQPPAFAKQREVFTFAYDEGSLSYHRSLLSFVPTLDAYDQSSDFEIFVIKDKKTSATKFDFINKLTVDEQKKLKSEKERRFTGGNNPKQTHTSDGIQIAFKAFGRSFRFPPHKRFKNEAEARKAIEEFIKRQKENFITGTGELIGNEAIQSRQVHNLQGLGEQFSGKYYFTKVMHRVSRGGGYKTEFACRKVIEDVIVQSNPAADYSENDKTLQRLKGERKDKKPTGVSTADAFGTTSGFEDTTEE